MQPTAHKHLPYNLWTRHYVEFLTAIAILFTLQTGLVPFDFTTSSPSGSAREFLTTIGSNLTFPDIISNIFLYVPLGMLLHWTLCRRGANRTLAVVATIVLGLLISLTIEWIQSYSLVRVSSAIDLVANGMGTALGAVISWIARRIVPRILDSAYLEFRVRPLAAALKGYCLLLVIFAAMPFSFSFDVARFKRAVMGTNFVPFAVHDTVDAGGDEVESAEVFAVQSYRTWRHMKRWSRWVAECVSFVLLTWLLTSVLLADYEFRRQTALVLVCYLGIALAIGLSLLQLPIVSRTCDVTDIVFRVMGVGIGIVTCSRYVPIPGVSRSIHRTRPITEPAKLCLMLTFGYILYTGLIPLTFHRASPTAAIAAESFLPFFAYFVARFDLMMADVMEKFAAYFILSALLATMWQRVATQGGLRRYVPMIGVVLALSGLIETAQVFIPVRIPSLTDPILAVAGCLSGAFAQQHIMRFYRYAVRSAPVQQDEGGGESTPAGSLPPSDALIATLSEPRDDAPAEPSPTRQHPVARRKPGN